MVSEDKKMDIWIELLKYVAVEVAKALLRKALEYGVQWAIAQYRKGY